MANSPMNNNRSPHRLYSYDQDTLIPQDYYQGQAALEHPTQFLQCPGQSPFLQISKPDQDEQQQEVVAANDLPISDMELAGFLEMDDKTLSELAGVNSAEWNSLFNGQLDDVNTPDPMTGIQSSMVQSEPMLTGSTVQQQQQQQQQPVTSGAGMDRWLVEETQKLERQQKIQQQKLLELQQTLLKTEILKNQLQIATISSQSHSQSSMSTASSLLLSSIGNASLSHNTQLLNSNPAATNTDVKPVKRSTSEQSPKTAANMSMAGSFSSRGGRMSTSLVGTSESPPDVKPNFSLSMSSPSSPPMNSEPNSPPEEPCKRRVHNLIEKKYRCSINDRICLLRDMVSKHCKDNKKLQKSAVLQKTIDFIHHLQNTIKKLQDENQQLREALAMATGKTNLPSFSSPPNTPLGTCSSCDSEVDSGHPSSPDSVCASISNDSYNYTANLMMQDGQMSHGPSPTAIKTSFFNRYLPTATQQNASRYLLVVMLAAVFFINPLSLFGTHGPALQGMVHSVSSVRTLQSSSDLGVDSVQQQPVNTLVYIGFWLLRILAGTLCFGWMTLKSMPKVMANSQDSVQFWRFKKQAEKDLQKGELRAAKDHLALALSVINLPVPTSYFGIAYGLLWGFVSHVVFQLFIGRCSVSFASMFIWNKAEKDGTYVSPKKPVLGVTFDDVSQTYHLLHQINLSSYNESHLRGMGFYLGLNALNFAEADRPFNRLSTKQLADMYFTMGLQCCYSLPFGASLPMWYYFFCFRTASPSKCPTPLRWAVTEAGQDFIMSKKWSSDARIASRLYVGYGALPLYSVTRAYCKELLSETFNYLLLPDEAQASRDTETALQAFKSILALAKEANTCLLNADSSGMDTRAPIDYSDSGFTVVQWWASVGIVSCYWLAGKDSYAEDYYPNIESLSGEMGAAVPSALQLAFKANRMYKKPATAAKAVPLDIILQLCATSTTALESSVANLLQDHSNSTESQLHQLGLLQACDWLLSLKLILWEDHGKESGLSQEICPGLYQDLETLSKLVTLLPSARSRLHLYKGCYQLIAGANPITAHAMLNSTSLIRRRRNSKEGEESTVHSHEQQMAKTVAFKHLPASMDPPSVPLSPLAPGSAKAQ